MADIEITRNQIIVVDSVGENDYKDLTFTDKEGKDYKISAKRAKYFEGKIIPNQAVQLNYAVFMKKEYIYSADLVKDYLPPPVVAKPVPVPVVKSTATAVMPTATRESSIEAQTSFKGFIELCVADKLKLDGWIMKGVVGWALDKMGIEIPELLPTAPELKTKPIIPETGKEHQPAKAFAQEMKDLVKELPSTREQQLKIQKMANDKGIVDETKEYISKNFNKDTTKALTKIEADKVIKTLEEDNIPLEGAEVISVKQGLKEDK